MSIGNEKRGGCLPGETKVVSVDDPDVLSDEELERIAGGVVGPTTAYRPPPVVTFQTNSAKCGG